MLGDAVDERTLDLFGRIRSLNKARLADYLSLEETRRSTVAASEEAYWFLADILKGRDAER